MPVQTRLFIAGDFVDAADGATFAVHSPHDAGKLADVAEAGAADVDRAVEAARSAFIDWSATPAAERGRLLLRLADAIEDNADELAELEAIDTGHPIRDARGLDAPRTVATFRYFGGMADKYEGSVIPAEPGFLNYLVRQPVGVVGQIVPWNFPLMFTSWKLGPALAAGNTVVLKPAELTPLSTLRVAELIAEVGFPPGTVNVVPGLGPVAGAHLAAHRGVQKLSFTGSTEVGRQIVHASAGNLKRLHLELGGKGANVVFADADLDAAVNGSAFAIFHNQGQACIAGSRLLLEDKIAGAFLERFLALARSIRVGNPLDSSTEMGPLTSPEHRDRVLAYVKVAIDQGAEVLCGGRAPDAPELAAGCYLEPTVVRARPGDRVSREEVFGPFVTVTTFQGEAEALEIANSVDYGLGGGLWTRDLSRAHRFAQAMRSGMVWINSYKRVNPASPFGGVGDSGYGREMGFGSRRIALGIVMVPEGTHAAAPGRGGPGSHPKEAQMDTYSYDRAVRTLEAELLAVEQAFRGLTAEQWRTPTLLQPLDQSQPHWTLFELAGHFDISIGLTRMLMAEPQRGQVGRDRVSFFIFPRSEVAPVVYDYAYTMVDGKTPEQMPEVLHETFSKTVQEARALPPETVGPGYYALMRLDEFVTSRVVEAVVHGMDLTDALGREPMATPEGVTITASILDDLLARRTVAGRPADLPDDLAWVRAASGRAGHPDPRLPLIG